MTERSCLGWRVRRDEWDAFLNHVAEKWGTTESYVRFELESAMREFIDADETLYETEQLLRGYLDARTLSSSSAHGTGITTHGETVQLGYRVQTELKAEFAALANEHYDENLGAVLTRALNSYR